MESQRSGATSKKRDRVLLYKKKMHNIQHRASRVNHLKQIASKYNDELLHLTSQMTVLKKTVNKTAAYNKALYKVY